MGGKNGIVAIEPRLDPIVASEGTNGPLLIGPTDFVPTFDGSVFSLSTSNPLDVPHGTASYATRLLASTGSADSTTAILSGVNMTFSPSGIHLKPSEGTPLVKMLDDQYFSIAKMMDNDPNSAGWRDNNPRVVLNIQHWESPPEDLENLMTGLQQWADDFGFTVCLKWKDADGPKAYEFEPPWVREAQDGQVMMASSKDHDTSEAELFELLKQNPDDDAIRQVYADYLMSKRDPLGELIALQSGPQTEETRKWAQEIENDLIKDLEKETGIRVYSSVRDKDKELVGSLNLDSELLEFLLSSYKFKDGFLNKITLTDPDAESISAMFKSRLGFGIHDLVLHSIHTANFPEILRHLVNLKSLQIYFQSGVTISDEILCMKKLAMALPSLSLSSLTLSRNDIGDKGFMALLAGLPGSNLQKLDVSETSIGDRSVRELTKILPQTKIRMLNLGNNQISDRVLLELSRVLPSTMIEEAITDAAVFRVVENENGKRVVEIED